MTEDFSPVTLGFIECRLTTSSLTVAGAYSYLSITINVAEAGSGTNCATSVDLF